MPAIEWSGGQIDKAATWQELLDRVRDAQWAKYKDEAHFREGLAARAYRWNLTEIDPELPPVQFFAALEGAKLIEILDRSTDNSEEE